MRVERLERSFLRWRERGDVRALERVFNRTAPELMALSRHLVRDPALAEDLVQQTFLVAIERAARFDAERRLVPWLVGILVQEARAARRRAGRVIDPERLPPEPRADALEDAARHELSDALKVALDELPERDRRILAPYLVDGRPPREIAHEQGLAPGTVRVRIHRGLDRLRARLPAGLALGAGLAVLPRGLDSVRARVLEAAAKVSVPAAGVPVGAAFSSMRGVVVVCAAVAAGGVWATVEALAPSTPRGPLVPTPELVGARSDARAAAVVMPELHVASQLAQVAPRVPTVARDVAGRAPVEERAARGRLHVQVSGLVPPAAPVSFTVELDEAGSPVLAQVEENGTTLVELPRAAQELQPMLAVRAEDERYEPLTVYAQRTGERDWFVELPLARREASVSGVVRLPAGCTLEWSKVRVSLHAKRNQPWMSGFEEKGSARCEAGGGFVVRLDAATPGTLVVRAEGFGLVQGSVDFDEGPHVDVGELELGAGVSLSGVALHEGRPLREGQVIAWSQIRRADPFLSGSSDVGWDGERFRHTKAEALVAADGSFHLGGLQAGEYELSVVPSIGKGAPRYHHVRGEGVSVEAPADGLRVESRLRALRVEVWGDDGPLPRASVRRKSSAGGFLDLGEVFNGGVDAAGASVLWVHPEVELELELTCPGYESRELDLEAAELPVGQPLVVVLERVESDTELVLLFDRPAAVEGVRVGAVMWSLELGIHYLEPVVVRAGRARFRAVPPGEFQVRLDLHLEPERPPDEQSYARPHGFETADVDERDGSVRVPTDPGGRIRLHLSGVGPSAPELVLIHAGKEHRPAYLVPRGERGTVSVDAPQAGVPALLGRARAPGAWIVRQVGEAYAEAQVEVQVRAGETVDAHLSLRSR